MAGLCGALSTAGCTLEPAGHMTIAEGGGVASWTPTSSFVTGTGKELLAVKATFRTEDLAALRSALQATLRPDSGAAADPSLPNFRLILNPSPPAPGQCSPGVGHACLVVLGKDIGADRPWTVRALDTNSLLVAGAFFPKPPKSEVDTGGTEALWHFTDPGSID